MKTLPRAESGILESNRRGGLYRLASGALPGLERSSNELGLFLAKVDLRTCDGKAALLDRIATALHFPEWFGHNWDALADCLDDLGWLAEPGCVLVLEAAEAFERRAPTDFFIAAEILEATAADAGRKRGTPLWVLFGSDDAPHDPEPPTG